MSEKSVWLSEPTLAGEHVTLRPFTVEDADAMSVILADPEVLRLTGSARSSDEIAARLTAAADTAADASLREWYGTRSRTDERLDLAVVDNATGLVVGEVVLNEFDRDARSANFRTLLGAAGRGRGLGTEAARLIIGHGFTALGLHRVELGVYAFNPRAQHVYTTLGFVVEGVRRDAFTFDGRFVDDIVMSILESEWAAHAGRPQLVSRSTP